MSCSFCNSILHNIRNCNDPTIGLTNITIRSLFRNIMVRYPNNIEVKFKEVLRRSFSLRFLRAVCAIYTNFPLLRTKDQIIDVLYEHYKQRILLSQEVTRLPTQPDTIPYFASDLEQQEEEHHITWYIDRTPTVTESLIGLSHINTIQIPQYSEYESITGSDLININLTSHFDEASGNIPFTPQVKKYNICPILTLDEVEKEGVEECPICYESIKCMDLVKLNCDHKFCGGCVNGWLKAHNNISGGPRCALCRNEIKTVSVKDKKIYDLVSEYCVL